MNTDLLSALQSAVAIISSNAPFDPEEANGWLSLADECEQRVDGPLALDAITVLWHLAERLYANGHPDCARLFGSASALTERLEDAAGTVGFDACFKLADRLTNLELNDDALTCFASATRLANSLGPQYYAHKHISRKAFGERLFWTGRYALAVQVLKALINDLEAEVRSDSDSFDQLSMTLLGGYYCYALSLSACCAPRRAISAIRQAADVFENRSDLMNLQTGLYLNIAMSDAYSRLAEQAGPINLGEGYVNWVSKQWHDQALDSLGSASVKAEELSRALADKGDELNEEQIGITALAIRLREADLRLRDEDFNAVKGILDSVYAEIQSLGGTSADIQLAFVRNSFQFHWKLGDLSPAWNAIQGFLDDWTHRHIPYWNPRGAEQAELLLRRCEVHLLSGSANDPKFREVCREEAMRDLPDVADLDDQFLDRNLPFLSEFNRFEFAAPVTSRSSRILGCLWRLDLLEGENINWAYNLVLRRKGKVTTSVVAQWRKARAGDASEARMFKQVQQLRREAIQNELEGYQDISSYRIKGAGLQQELDELEPMLYSSSGTITSNPALGDIDWRELASTLPQNAVLIDYVSLAGVGEPDRYGAFLLRRDGPPAYFDLGEAEQINQEIKQLADGITSSVMYKEVKKEIMECAQRVAKAILWPLIEQVEKETLLLICPVNAIASAPFSMLPMNDGKPVIEYHAWSFLPSATWLMLTDEGDSDLSDPLVFGDPDFNLTTRPPGGDLFLSRLPYSGEEAKKVAQKLGVPSLTRQNATKAKLLSADAPLILHLATHGILLAPKFSEEIATLKSIQQTKMYSKAGILFHELSGELGGVEISKAGMRRAWLGAAAMEDHHLHSAIMLAGFNAWLQEAETPEECGNGLVTAADIALLDLDGTELVIFSACQSGLGLTIDGDESVVGLRRAVLLAGARSCVSSLWNVDDDSTSELMVLLYQNLASGMSRAEALRKAQQEIRAKPQYANPFYWAPLVCQGDYGPMSKYKEMR